MHLNPEPETPSVSYPCNIDKKDSLSVALRFEGPDLEFMTLQGGTKYPVYMSVDSVQDIYAQLGEALHAHFEE